MTAVVEDRERASGTERGPVASADRVRLLVVDDHHAVRRGLGEMLEEQPDFEVLASAATAEEALLVAERTMPDVVVVAYQLRGRSGLWLSHKLKRLRRPPIVVIYSACADGLLSAAAVVAEADALLSKAGLGSKLCDAIRSAAAGRLIIPVLPWQHGEVIRRRLDGEQQAIYGMLLAGIAPEDVAKTLGMSVSALESRRREMLRALEGDTDLLTAQRDRQSPGLDARTA
ncbi:MAG: response regulator [Solirubrobacteraceae bacterium]